MLNDGREEQAEETEEEEVVLGAQTLPHALLRNAGACWSGNVEELRAPWQT